MGALCLALAWLTLTSGHPGLSIVAPVTAGFAYVGTCCSLVCCFPFYPLPLCSEHPTPTSGLSGPLEGETENFLL